MYRPSVTYNLLLTHGSCANANQTSSANPNQPRAHNPANETQET